MNCANVTETAAERKGRWNETYLNVTVTIAERTGQWYESAKHASTIGQNRLRGGWIGQLSNGT